MHPKVKSTLKCFFSQQARSVYHDTPLYSYTKLVAGRVAHLEQRGNEHLEEFLGQRGGGGLCEAACHEGGRLYLDGRCLVLQVRHTDLTDGIQARLCAYNSHTHTRFIKDQS